eukprot:554367_1
MATDFEELTSLTENNHFWHTSKMLRFFYNNVLAVAITEGLLISSATLLISFGYIYCHSGSFKDKTDSNTNGNPNGCDECIQNNTFQCIDYGPNIPMLFFGYLSLVLLTIYTLVLLYFHWKQLIQYMERNKTTIMYIIILSFTILSAGVGIGLMIIGVKQCPKGMWTQTDNKERYNPNKCKQCIGKTDFRCDKYDENSVLIVFGVILLIFGIFLCQCVYWNAYNQEMTERRYNQERHHPITHYDTIALLETLRE